jgi:hypothetical protein
MILFFIAASSVIIEISKNSPCIITPQDCMTLTSVAPLNFDRILLTNTSVDNMINIRNININSLYCTLDAISIITDVKSSGHLPEIIIGSESRFDITTEVCDSGYIMKEIKN